jgi:hypothetical protein
MSKRKPVRYCVRQRVTGKTETYDLPPGAGPYATMAISPLITWERRRCPWWHRVPLVRRFVNHELP